VYQGELKDGVTVAIKRMKKESKQGMREFINEVRLLGRLRHTNLVQLVGFCATEEEQLLCYEYMSNGNLAQHLRGGLSDSFKFPLVSWVAFTALEYMQSGQVLDYRGEQLLCYEYMLDPERGAALARWAG
jgi:serine/threonine protein kinase